MSIARLLCDGPPPIELHTRADLARIRRLLEKIVLEDREAEEREREAAGEVDPGEPGRKP